MNGSGRDGWRSPRRVAWVIGAALLLVVVVIFLTTRPKHLPSPATEPVETAKQQALGSTASSFPTTHPSATRWLGTWSYLDAHNTLISVYDSDGDGLYDADEIARYGSLAYDSRSKSDAPRLSLRPSADESWDSDGDGLPDEWERGYFGTLDRGADDDPDEDGFPNAVELANGSSPVRIDLADPNRRPKTFSSPTTDTAVGAFSMSTQAFWDKQAGAAQRVKNGRPATQPAVKGFRWKPEKAKTAAAGPANPPGFPAGADAARFAGMARRPLKLEEDQDADGLPDAWERQHFASLDHDRQADPDGDGLPNVVEWYLGTNPSKADRLADSLRPAELIDLSAPRNPWDPWWDIRSRRLWAAQAALPQEMKPAVAENASAARP